MKLKYLLMIVLTLLVISISANKQLQSAKAYKVSAVEQDDTVKSNLSVAEKSKDLTTKWLNALGTDGWLYVSSYYETEEILGNDPETGLPLPNKSFWESWYQLDSLGQQTTALVKRTDLENGNITYVAWQNDKLYRLPSGAFVDTSQQGNVWRTFRPLHDHSCNTRLPEFTSSPSPENGVSKELLSTLEENVEGINEWVVTMITLHPPISDVSGFSGTFTGEHFVCHWNNDTGAIRGTEQYLMTETGEKVLIGRDSNYNVQRVAQPPVEMLEVLDQLISLAATRP